MSLRVDPQSPISPSRQLVEGLLDRIAVGAAGAGDKLPSVRALAVEALVNPNTVSKAYRELEMSGVVEGRAGSGMFVTDAGPRIAREMRRRDTLADLEMALSAALRAGHDHETLITRLERRLRRSPVEQGSQ